MPPVDWQQYGEEQRLGKLYSEIDDTRALFVDHKTRMAVPAAQLPVRLQFWLPTPERLLLRFRCRQRRAALLMRL